MSWNDVIPAWLLETAEPSPSRITRYVAGFAFERGNVALIVKQRPAWQKGKMNGIGGHIEPGESPIEAMVREFYEETGRETSSNDWMPFAVLGNGHDFEVHFFRAYLGNLDDLQSPTDENVKVIPVSRVNAINCIPNLTWLIPMAFSMDFDRTDVFSIKEIYADQAKAAA